MTTSKEGVTEGPLQILARGAWQSLLVIGILSVVIGLMILIWPGPTLVVAGILFGFYLVFSGVLQLVAAMGPHVGAGWRVLSIVSGILSFILAVFCFRHIGDSLVLLALWIAVSWLFRGMSVLIGGTESPAGTPGRGWTIFFGILLLIGGVFMVAWPVHSIAALTLLIGWWLLFMGIMEIVEAFQVRSATKRAVSAAAAAA